MEAGRKQLWTYVAAAALVFLTLYVFYRLQDYGPESAIRRFHADVMSDDVQDLQSVTEQRIEVGNAALLRAQVRQWLSEGWSYELLRMERAPFEVRAAVVYTPPVGPTLPMIWVVEKDGRSWRVNADKTVAIFRDALGLLRRP